MVKDKNPSRSTTIDQQVGQRLRLQRQAMGWTQTDLGARLGVTFQQVQKYENGANRISAGRLFQMAKILNVPITAFFDGVEETSVSAPSEESGLAGNPVPMLAAYSRVRTNRGRSLLVKLVQAVADLEEKAHTNKAC